MEGRFLHCSFLLLGFFLLAVGQSDAAPEARILNEKGELITTVPTLWLDRQHLAIPAAAYRHFGLGVGYDNELRLVFVFVSGSCQTMGFRSRGHRSYHPDVGFWPERSPYPLALKRKSHFYVSVREVEENFEYFTSTWDAETKQLTLRKRAFKNEDDAGEQ